MLFRSPFAVRVSASRPAIGPTVRDDEWTLHFVNYNRDEPPPQNGRPSAGAGIQDEKPIAATGVRADFIVLPGSRIASVQFITPEKPDPVTITSELKNGRLQFAVPEFLVYGVVTVKLKRE